MKLNKPKVTDNQSELESYVASLLKDNSEPVLTDDSKVTPLRSKKSRSQESLPENRPIKAELSKQESIKHSLIEDSLNSKLVNSEVAESKVAESLNNELDAPQTNLTEKSTGILASVDRNPIDLTPLEGKSTPRLVDVEIAKQSRKTAEEQPVSNNHNSTGASNKTKAAQEHHERIAKEFKDYQESAHGNAPESDPRLKNVEKLLSRIALASVVSPNSQSNLETTEKSKPDYQVKSDVDTQESNAVSAEVAEASFLHRDSMPMKDLLGEIFQTLVFEVHKLPLAVPLVKLGGIVNFIQKDVTPLVGTPDWFLGLVPNERGNLMVVDTQKFLMPEKVPSVPVEYEYLIVLDNSNWALACHAVNDAKNLSPDDIRWSARSSKRPWFAGMVVEYMSALVEVDELINMLAENVVE